jgi:hypothetical protein
MSISVILLSRAQHRYGIDGMANLLQIITATAANHQVQK